MTDDPEGTNDQLLANALSRAEKAESEAAALREKLVEYEHREKVRDAVGKTLLETANQKMEAATTRAEFLSKLYDQREERLGNLDAANVELRAELAEREAIIRGFLRCPEIADCDPRDLDQDTRALERRARTALEAHVQPLVPK